MEDSISQCPFLQMTAETPHADSSAAPGARPRYRPPRHRDLHATSHTHDNWMAARQTSCRQQTAPAQPRCSKDVTAHPHRPGARPGRPCPVPACNGQPPSGRMILLLLFLQKQSDRIQLPIRNRFFLLLSSSCNALQPVPREPDGFQEGSLVEILNRFTRSRLRQSTTARSPDQ
jgi:hypothetical protein